MELKTSDNNNMVLFPNTAVYSFICYLPQSIGIFIGRLFNFPVVIQAYLGRIMNFACFVLLMFFAIKYIPYKKNLVTLFAFMPMMIQEGMSLAPDALTNGVAFFLISYVLCLKNSKGKLTNKNKMVLSLSCILMSFLKIVYLPICLILFLLPYEKFKSKKDKFINILSLAAFVVVLNAIWLFISSGYLNEIKPGVNPSGQLWYIIKNPIIFVGTIFNTLNLNFDLYIYNIIGNSLCYFDVNLSSLFIIPYLMFIVYLVLFDGSNKVDKNDKVLSILIMLSTCILICVSLYIQWNPLGEHYIDGIQGRYLIPLLIPLILALNNKKVSLKKDQLVNITTISYVFILFISIYSLLQLTFYHI